MEFVGNSHYKAIGRRVSRMNPFVRYFGIAISVAEFLVLVAYYYPLVRAVPTLNLSEAEALRFDDNFVSDLLFNDSRYRVLLTILVGLHLGVCFYFVVELNRKKGCGCFPVMMLELFCLVVAWMGWVILSSIYTDASGEISTEHILGAGVFIFACGSYFVLLVFNVAFQNRDRWTRLEIGLFGLVLFCFILSLASGFLFLASFWKAHIIGKRVMCGWIYEHASFILFISAHVWLFVVEGKFEAHGYRQSVSNNTGIKAVRIHKTDVC